MTELTRIPPYETERHLTAWKATPLSREFVRHPMAAVMGLCGAMACTAIGALALSGLLSMIIGMIPGIETDFGSLYLATSATAFPFVLFWALGLSLREVDTDLINAIRGRLQEYAKNHMASDGLACDRTTLDLILADPALYRTGRSRTTLLRLDAILQRLWDTVDEIGTDKEALSKAHAITVASLSKVLDQHRIDLSIANSNNNALDKLEHSCRSITENGFAPGMQVIPTAPTARIARIVDTAERMLAAHPDMLDSQGMRVADLVRVHVPRLLSVHAEATRTASIDKVAGVDARLESGVEDIRASVEDAGALLHDNAMDALVTELRFLTLRRGGEPLLRSVG